MCEKLLYILKQFCVMLFLFLLISNVFEIINLNFSDFIDKIITFSFAFIISNFKIFFEEYKKFMEERPKWSFFVNDVIENLHSEPKVSLVKVFLGKGNRYDWINTTLINTGKVKIEKLHINKQQVNTKDINKDGKLEIYFIVKSSLDKRSNKCYKIIIESVDQNGKKYVSKNKLIITKREVYFI